MSEKKTVKNMVEKLESLTGSGSVAPRQATLSTGTEERSGSVAPNTSDGGTKSGTPAPEPKPAPEPQPSSNDPKTPEK